MAPSPSTKRKKLKGKAGEALRQKRRVVIRKAKSNSWFDISRRPWFKSVKAFLLADSFAYGPLVQEVKDDASALPDMKTVLKDVLVDSPTKVLKGAIERTPGILKEALLFRREREDQLFEAETSSEEEQSDTGEQAGGQAVHNIEIETPATPATPTNAGGQAMGRKQSEAGAVASVGGGQLLRSSFMTIQRKVLTTTTTTTTTSPFPHENNQLPEFRWAASTPQPQSPTLDTEMTDLEEADGDEEESHEHASVDFETAQMVAIKLIKKLGGRFSEELGIHVDKGDDEVERWFLAANLFSRSVSFSVSKQTYKELMAMGISKTLDFLNADEAKLTELFERTGYNKYGQRITTHFRRLAYQVRDELDGRVTTLKPTADPAELVRRLRSLSGVRVSAVHGFMRELRGIWTGCDAEFDSRTKKAAVHLKLVRSAKRETDPEGYLKKFAQEAGMDVRDLEAACFKLGTEHDKDYGTCKGGLVCEGLSSRDSHNMAGVGA
ncbi:hypothetical protein R1sor_001000 [Riccia sorocarpa]|uniref:Uncharacterized protein n=1 Tax=Riccia sorocarpa TaxID=122646 RepID=A0ABD3GV12_9MARC